MDTAMKYWVGLIGLMLASSFAGSQTATAQTKISIGYTAAGDFLPAFVAYEKGYFAKRGIDASFTRVALASNIPAALMSKSIDIGAGTGSGLLQAVEGGLDLVAVCGAARQRSDNPTVSLLARKDLNINSPVDLKGKKIGVPGLNSVIDVVLRVWLEAKGVPVNQVTLIEASFPQMNDLLRGKTLDAVAVLEPFRSKIEQDGTAVKVSDFFSEVHDGMIFGFWISTRLWADANPKAVTDFREALAEAIVYAKAYPEDVKTIEAKYLGVKMPGFSSFDIEIKPADLDVYAKMGKDLGLLRENVNAVSLIVK
jgi:NitT/TauT family transport system substrate-binding protein